MMMQNGYIRFSLRSRAMVVTGTVAMALLVIAWQPLGRVYSQSQPEATGPTRGTVPPVDFSGVYYPIRPPGNQAKGKAALPPGAPRPRPTQTGPLSDGSLGRSPTNPELKPEYMAKWEAISKSRIAGSYQYDPTAKCLSTGMPAMMAMGYGMEVLQTRDKITFFGELNDMLRRVYLDGRKPTQKLLDDPTYAGYSTGHWEGDTLVVDTVALRDDTFLENFSPHSEQLTVHERIRFAEPGVLEDRITATDPKAFFKPWSTVFRYRKAKYPNDELREFSCPEGLGEAK